MGKMFCLGFVIFCVFWAWWNDRAQLVSEKQRLVTEIAVVERRGEQQCDEKLLSVGQSAREACELREAFLLNNCLSLAPQYGVSHTFCDALKRGQGGMEF